MAGVDEVEVVVAHHERATLRVGDVFLKIDADQTRTGYGAGARVSAPSGACPAVVHAVLRSARSGHAGAEAGPPAPPCVLRAGPGRASGRRGPCDGAAAGGHRRAAQETALGSHRFGHDVKQAADVADRAMGAIHETSCSLQ
jgi:hypothetical protein